MVAALGRRFSSLLLFLQVVFCHPPGPDDPRALPATPIRYYNILYDQLIRNCLDSQFLLFKTQKICISTNLKFYIRHEKHFFNYFTFIKKQTVNPIKSDVNQR